ncbi:MAG: hypothetical protein VCC01_10750 [Candidatus Hydrogenedentota bacterium]|jgi:hypothetical protein
MGSFDTVSKLMLVLGVAGGLYTLVYAFWLRKSKDSHPSDASPGERQDSDND